MNRRARNSVIALIGTVGALYAVALGYIAVNETRLVFPGARPRELARSVPQPDAGIPWDSVRIKAPDGVPVFLIVSRLADGASRPWVLYFHGNGGHSGSQGSVERYRLFREAGFNVLSMEFRGFGASSAFGTPSSASLATDARTTWDHLIATYGASPSQVALYGWSLGGGVASQLAAAVSPAAIITEGAFTSLAQMGAEVYPWLPVGLVTRNRFDNVGIARSLGTPWLVFHGRSDDVVPFTHGEALAAAAKSGRLIALDADHDGGVEVDRAVALEALRSLARGLQPAAGTAATSKQ